jgi:hypothetical protein
VHLQNRSGLQNLDLPNQIAVDIWAKLKRADRITFFLKFSQTLIKYVIFFQEPAYCSRSSIRDWGWTVHGVGEVGWDTEAKGTLNSTLPRKWIPLQVETWKGVAAWMNWKSQRPRTELQHCQELEVVNSTSI